MKKTLPATLLLGASLASCNMTTAPTRLEVHDVLLYGDARDRIVWFYGELRGNQLAQDVKIGTEVVTLKENLSKDAFNLKGTLAVNGRSTFRAGTTALGERFSVTSVPLSSNLVLRTKGQVEAVYYTDGNRWFKLSGALGANAGGSVRPVENTGLRGAGALTNAEADALARSLQGQGPLAVAVLPSADLPDRPLAVEPKPEKYLQTGLMVQRGIPVDVLGGTVPGIGSVRTGEVRSGSQSGHSDSGARAVLDNSASSFAQTWRTANASLIPAPATPSIDFGRYSVATFFLGQRPNGGYGLTYRSARAENDTLILTVEVREPRPGQITTQALVSPWVSVPVEGRFTRLEVRDTTGKVLARN
ncbi:hypothetical protein HNR42_001472 [Deinobacterium chartae]|uniref:PrcB C-terminal domain-containing protein n=1 Tax=Deinobacterium chartae TaxID=521158 RepID=A0A841I0W2_9DEIO|nr:protease complex subunit PrcB family protein [Deinobacterium chartae]MBB6098049.1 hypothetical protein [Deinobacterium chartae]